MKALHAGILIIPQRVPIEVIAQAVDEQLTEMVENELFEWVRGRG